MLIRSTKSQRVGLIRRASVASGVEYRMRFAYPAYKNTARRPDKTRQRRIRRYIPDVAT
ncbi:ribonucleoside diphosphate reductase 1 subunit beta [Escherichia coli]|nr:ribonucleoside diphosphate reductase 1 subunit beta [Escherichia coli]TFA48511.1 ribonucleoside diphosphate reductase 1 subunit beta [Escherichia coli]